MEGIAEEQRAPLGRSSDNIGRREAFDTYCVLCHVYQKTEITRFAEKSYLTFYQPSSTPAHTSQPLLIRPIPQRTTSQTPENTYPKTMAIVLAGPTKGHKMRQRELCISKIQDQSDRNKKGKIKSRGEEGGKRAK